MGVVEVSGQKYHMNDNLIKKWDKIRKGRLKKIDEDRVYICDGRERTGKSVFAGQQIAYIDPSIVEDERKGIVLPRIPIGDAKSWEHDSEWKREATKRYKEGTLLPRITFDAKETLKSIREYRSNERETKGIWFDEAFRGMSSKGALSKENKVLAQAMMEMGQNNLVMFIVSPSFFLLELYPAMLRSNALFHVKKDNKSLKRMVRIFNFRKKAKLYQIGIRKGWGYPLRTNQVVNFYNLYPAGKDFEWRYRLKKQLSLREVGKEEENVHKWKKQRNICVKALYEVIKDQKKVSESLKNVGFNLSQPQISSILKDF